MRRENRRKKEAQGLDTRKTLYVVGAVLGLAVIAFVITFIVYGNVLNESTKLGTLTPSNNLSNSYSNDIATETSTSYGKTVNEVKETTSTQNDKTASDDNTQKVAINTSNVEEEKKEEEKTIITNNSSNSEKSNTKTEVTENKPNAEKEEKQEAIETPKFKMPVEGDIVKEFANNKLVYSTTLDVWATHNGVDIRADQKTVVKASAGGKVEAIKNDPRYGLTIIIEHANGFKTVYANLLSTEFVVVGEEVEQGQSIGTVGNTATFEISDAPHLHFELLKENEQQDPELYLERY